MMSKTRYEERKLRIKNMSDSEFEIYCRDAWKKWESSIKNSEDSIPYNEFYSEMCADYDRETNY